MSMRWKVAALGSGFSPNWTAGASGVPSNQNGMANPSASPSLPYWVRTCS
jgi:hypothetical protein